MITANDLKTKGVAVIQSALEKQTEAIISVRGLYWVLLYSQYTVNGQQLVAQLRKIPLGLCRQYAVTS
mgnify:CR=1 FL=1